MSVIADVLRRLRAAVIVDSRGRGSDVTTIKKRDLAELLQDYDRIDAAYRDLHSRTAAAEQPYRDPRTGEATWSANGEDWHNYESVEELIRETEHDLCSLEPGSVVYVGTKRHYDPAEFIDTQSLLQEMNENASQSDAGEWVDNWPTPSKPAEEELEALLADWARRHCPPDFYLVENVRLYTITAEDMERASQPAGIDSEGSSHD